MTSRPSPPNYIEQFEKNIQKRDKYMSPAHLEGDTIIFTKAPTNSAIAAQRSNPHSFHQSTGYELKERTSSELRNLNNFKSSQQVKPFNSNIQRKSHEYKKPPQGINNKTNERFRSSQEKDFRPADLNNQISPQARKFDSRPIEIGENSADITKSLKNLNISKKEFQNENSIENQKLKKYEKKNFLKENNEMNFSKKAINPVESKDIVFESSMVLSPIRTEYVDSKMEEVQEMNHTMEKALKKSDESVDLIYQYQSENNYYVDKSLLQRRRIIGHINPLTLKFSPVVKSDGKPILTKKQLRIELNNKVLFVFVDKKNLEKILIFSTFENDLKNGKNLSKNLMILGHINPATLRFVPDIYPGEGFYDWESCIKGKRGMFGHLDPETNFFVPAPPEVEDYVLNPTLACKIAIIGHIDPISKKFIQKLKKNGQKKGKTQFQKLTNVVLAHIDHNFPEVAIVVNSKAYDYELESLLKQSFLIQGRIDPQSLYFRVSTSMNKMTLYPNQRILKKKAVLGYIDPFTGIFRYNERDFRGVSLVDYLVKSKVVLSHIDSKYPEIGYIVLPHVFDEEISSKLTDKLRGVLGFIDPASLRFIPDVRPNKDDEKLLKRMIRRRAILGYLDPISHKFVKDDIPQIERFVKKTGCEFEFKSVGRDPNQVLMIGFLDPNHPSLCQVLRPGVKDFEVDSELIKKRTFLGTINPRSQSFLPLRTIEGINNVDFEDVLHKKLEIMGYNIKELPLFVTSENLKRFVLKYYNGPNWKDYTTNETTGEVEKIDMKLIEEKILNDQSIEDSFKLKINPVESQSSPESKVFVPYPENEEKKIFEKKKIDEEFEGSQHTSGFYNPVMEELEKEDEEEEYEIRKLSQRQKIVKNSVDVCLTDDDESFSSSSRKHNNDQNFRIRHVESELISSPNMAKVKQAVTITPDRKVVKRIFTGEEKNLKFEISKKKNLKKSEESKKTEKKRLRRTKEGAGMPIIVDKKLDKLKHKKKMKSLVYKRKSTKERKPLRPKSKSKSRTRTRSKSKFSKNSPHKKLTPIVSKKPSKRSRILHKSKITNRKAHMENMKKMKAIKRCNSAGGRSKKPLKTPKRYRRRRDLVYKPDGKEEKISQSKSESRFESKAKSTDRNNNLQTEAGDDSNWPVLIKRRVLERNGDQVDMQVSKSVTFIRKYEEKGQGVEKKRSERKYYKSTLEKRVKGSANRSGKKGKKKVRSRIDTGLRRKR